MSRGGLTNYGLTCYLNATLQAIKCLVDFEEVNSCITGDAKAKRLLKSFLMEGGSGEPFLRHISRRSENDPHMASSALKFLTLLVNTLVDEGSSSVVERFLIHNMSETLWCLKCTHKEGPLKFSENIPKFSVLITVAGSSLQDSVDRSLVSSSVRTCPNCSSSLISKLDMDLGTGVVIASRNPTEISLYPDSNFLMLFGQPYQLSSIVGHAGFHYTALCNVANEWLYFNDSIVEHRYHDPNEYCFQWNPVLLVFTKSDVEPTGIDIDLPIKPHLTLPEQPTTTWFPSLGNDEDAWGTSDDESTEKECTLCKQWTACWYSCLECGDQDLCPECKERQHGSHMCEKHGASQVQETKVNIILDRQKEALDHRKKAAEHKETSSKTWKNVAQLIIQLKNFRAQQALQSLME
ncbi:hypothetical protein Pelo_6038 [Pelomyxa schiedti]|nr:hypothetical protein Pelo_6038 [Pelomyxa schiedti]